MRHLRGVNAALILHGVADGIAQTLGPIAFAGGVGVTHRQETQHEQAG